MLCSCCFLKISMYFQKSNHLKITHYNNSTVCRDIFTFLKTVCPCYLQLTKVHSSYYIALQVPYIRKFPLKQTYHNTITPPYSKPRWLLVRKCSLCATVINLARYTSLMPYVYNIHQLSTLQSSSQYLNTTPLVDKLIGTSTAIPHIRDIVCSE